MPSLQIIFRQHADLETIATATATDCVVSICLWRQHCSCRLLSAASSTFGAFVIGAVGSVVGTIVAWLVLGSRLGPDGYKVSSHALMLPGKP